MEEIKAKIAALKALIAELEDKVEAHFAPASAASADSGGNGSGSGGPR